MKMLILMGLPGSGKSTYSQDLHDILNFVRINQDELGSRDKCAEKANQYINLAKNEKNSDLIICIDRTNIDKRQRANWIKLAKHHGIKEIECLYFKSTPEKCLERMIKRKDHPTIPQTTSKEKMKQIINKFYKSLEEPTHDEGLSSITVIHVDGFKFTSENDKST